MKKIKTVFIVGPTASGKTDLSIKLAKHFGGEIISADSMQIYKNIHIASAAPDTDEMQSIPHHLLEFSEPESSFSVADYVIRARECIKNISGSNKLPIVVGGTGLYINSLADNTEYTEEKTDLKLRQELEEYFDSVGAEEMLRQLSLFDGETALRLHKNDRKRIIRAFEVYKTTGRTITEQNALSHSNDGFIEPLIIGITYSDREKLYDRINLRVDLMLKNGLLEEAEAAFKRQIGGAYQAIGHKEFFGFFKGECTLEEAVENLKRQTRRYAKRQLTWFNKDKRIHWLYPDTDSDIVSSAIDKINEFLKEE